MKTKKKKLTSWLMILFLLVSFLGPNLSVAEDISTGFTEMETSEGINENIPSSVVIASPVIKAIWEMQGPLASLSGLDDSADAGAQFLPSGQYQVDKPISVCAVVFDADGADDINSVSSEIYYPMASFGTEAQDGRTGCGERKGIEKQMTRLTKEEGLALFCGAIKNNNANLPSFYDTYDFSGICGEEGELQAGTAAIYCYDGALSYDDPSGEYKVLISGEDKTGLTSNILQEKLSYLELTAFEADFTNIDYKKVALNTKKTVEGDLLWGAQEIENKPTVRNVGNTRLQMEILQNDMGMGKTDGIWNIRYGSKVGLASLWQNYWPEETILLDGILDLAKMDQLDFAIEVLKFPEDDTKDYSGKMTLNAKKAEHLACEIVQ